METAQPLPTTIPPVLEGGPFDTVKNEEIKFVDRSHKPNRMEKQAHTKDVPKNLRPHPGPIGKSEYARSLGLVPTIQDPIKTLGHPARPRKKS